MLIGIGVVLILILIGYLFHRKWKFRSIIISVSLILLAVVSYLIATNHQNHYGMHVFIDSSGSMLYSPIANHPRILLYDDGAPNNQKRVYYFKQYPNQPTISKTDSQAAITKVTIIEQPASLVTKTGYWIYNSSNSQFWFDFSHNNNQFDHKSYYFNINSSWIEMSITEAKQQHLLDANTLQQIKQAKIATY